MQFVKQRIHLPVASVAGDDDQTPKIRKKYKHSILLNDNLRMVVTGRSGSGKTRAVLSLLYHPNGLKFENVYIYCKSLFQPKYVYLKKILDSIKGINCYLFSSNDDVISPKEVKPYSVFLFDDILCDKQNNVQIFFSMGRHKNVDVIFISQSYAAISKRLIRENANFAILFEQDIMNLKHVYDDFGISSDMSFDQFREMCANCWKEKYSFVSVDLEREKNEGKYRKNFDTFIKFT